jgi:arylsulfatase A-like enzyme
VGLAGGDAAGAGFEGIDLLPMLRGTAPVVERTLFWRVGPAPAQARAVRSGDWKLVVDGTGAKQLLFDVTRDPGERDDLAARHPDRVRRLKEMLDAWEQDVGGTTAPVGR